MVNVSRLLKDLIGIFFQFRCHVCQKPTDFREVLCFRCRKKLTGLFSKPQLIADTRCNFPVYTMSSYDSLMQDAVRIIKYHPSKRLLESIVEIVIAEAVLEEWYLERDSIMIPVPMHNERYRKRGFNQAAEFAVAFSVLTRCNYSPALKRIRKTRPQADCNEEERLTNLSGAFALESLLKPEAFKNRRLIIVDDVTTTGMTLQECAEPLFQLKPSSVVGLVLSHSYRKS